MPSECAYITIFLFALPCDRTVSSTRSYRSIKRIRSELLVTWRGSRHRFCRKFRNRKTVSDVSDPRSEEKNRRQCPMRTTKLNAIESMGESVWCEAFKAWAIYETL